MVSPNMRADHLRAPVPLPGSSREQEVRAGLVEDRGTPSKTCPRVCRRPTPSGRTYWTRTRISDFQSDGVRKLGRPCVPSGTHYPAHRSGPHASTSRPNFLDRHAFLREIAGVHVQAIGAVCARGVHRRFGFTTARGTSVLLWKRLVKL